MLTATNISAIAASKFTKLPDNTVMISINEPNEYYPLDLDRNSSKILTTHFSDVIEDKPAFGQFSISYETIVEILNFIKNNLGKNFIIHCAAGVSRSAAICLYLHLIYKYELRSDFWQKCHPNHYVLGELIIQTYKYA